MLRLLTLDALLLRAKFMTSLQVSCLHANNYSLHKRGPKPVVTTHPLCKPLSTYQKALRAILLRSN